ncbi:fumarate hydratase C-terminal domain-containing protein [Eggerthella guodeyinii]|uniref:Fumarate hydratase C-terminal domain-containing protein n=1 Tax=Eggerthella guodeyinii TaxID=2690837 RepID=A0A6L7IRS3_9ACTN|nr:fumarate hydratase C-terminal domain-containing protein [Eggerthella guodeyinii]QOS67605.1 fumarate hydratase C-terminal domain-containing protein [Eggerthella guodeyinii]
MVIELSIPISSEDVKKLKPGDFITVSGTILAGRDAALPKVVSLAERGMLDSLGFDLNGSAIFHTAVSPAGVGPTSSNKLEIEASMPPLSQAGVRLHLGKGAIGGSTIQSLAASGSAYAIVPPVTALLQERTIEKRVIAFPELGMEALHALTVKECPAVIAAVNGEAVS